MCCIRCSTVLHLGQVTDKLYDGLIIDWKCDLDWFQSSWVTSQKLFLRLNEGVHKVTRQWKECFTRWAFSLHRPTSDSICEHELRILAEWFAGTLHDINIVIRCVFLQGVDALLTLVKCKVGERKVDWHNWDNIQLTSQLQVEERVMPPSWTIAYL